MNARKARTLRRWAKHSAAGLPERGIVVHGGYEAVRNTPQGPVRCWLGGTARHKPTTVRAVYQKLKKVYGRSNLGALK